MKKQIVKISAMQSAKVVAVIYLVTALPVCMVLMLVAMTGVAGFSMGMVIAVPIGYAIGGYIGTVIAAWVYNLVAARVGGVEFTTSEVGA